MQKHSRCIDANTTWTSPTFLALESRQIPIIFEWLDVQTFSLLDIALSSYNAREQWLTLLKSNTCKAINLWHHNHSSIRWVIARGITVTQILVSHKYRDTISDLTFEAVGINGGGTVCGEEAKGGSDLSIWKKSKYLQSIDLSGCRRITDVGLSALGSRCVELQTIDLSGCVDVTDIGLSALGHGCSQLQTINLFGCEGITDVGLSALGHGCRQLQTIDLFGCQGITDVGLSALGHGCSQLQKIDLAFCYLITDVGLSALGHGCRQLQKIDLYGCQGITSVGLSALCHGCAVDLWV
jgi:Leucine Rich repeat